MIHTLFPISDWDSNVCLLVALEISAPSKGTSMKFQLAAYLRSCSG